MSQVPPTNSDRSDNWKPTDLLKPSERWSFNIMMIATILLGIIGAIALLLK